MFKNYIAPTYNLNQQELFPKEKLKFTFGGEKTKGRRKNKRTIVPNKWIHLCLKSKKAYGYLSLLNKNNRRRVGRLIRKKSKEFNVVLRDAVNMGNHIHMKIRVKRHEDFKKFLRSISGQIARMVTGARKGKKFGQFWDALAFTRVLVSQLEELQLRGYFAANRAEREKGYGARVEMLAQFNSWLRSLKKQTADLDLG